MRKRFLGKNFVLSIVLALAVVLAPVGQAKAEIVGTTPAKPVFSSSFVQYWFAQKWDSSRWSSELTMLKNVGINEIILQNIADNKAKYAAYPTTIPGYTSNTVDMVGNALAAAASSGMKVRIGLGFDGDWWSKNASDSTWLNAEASKNIAIIDDIIQKYGGNPAFGGWYIPYEFSQFTATNNTQQGYLNSFFKKICDEINTKSAVKDIMVAPFYNGKYSLFSPLSSWSTMVQNILRDTGVTTVALQDSVGAGYNTTSQLANLYSYTKKATDALAMKLYADTETFTSTSKGNVPAAQTRITTQLSYEKTYVQGFVAFSIDHFQNANVSSQVKGYNDYKNYYLANK